MFLVGRAQSANSISPTKNYCSAVAMMHTLANVPSPTVSSIVINLRKALKNRFSSAFYKARQVASGRGGKKAPFVASHLVSMRILVWDAPLSSAVHLALKMIFIWLTLAHALFGRFSDLAVVLVCDIVFETCPNVLWVFIEQSKTDQLREGAWIPIACSCLCDASGAICEVDPDCAACLVIAWRDMSGRSLLPCESLFGRISTDGRGLIPESTLSYSRALTLVKEVALFIGEDPKAFGTQSGRIGGASAAANLPTPMSLIAYSRSTVVGVPNRSRMATSTRVSSLACPSRSPSPRLAEPSWLPFPGNPPPAEGSAPLCTLRRRPPRVRLFRLFPSEISPIGSLGALT